MGNFLKIWVTVRFSRHTLLHGHSMFHNGPYPKPNYFSVIISYAGTLFKWQWRKHLFSFKFFGDLTNESNKKLEIQV
jgi:hypothetical protein